MLIKVEEKLLNYNYTKIGDLLEKKGTPIKFEVFHQMHSNNYSKFCRLLKSSHVNCQI